jgi:hypothetical protein
VPALAGVGELVVDACPGCGPVVEASVEDSFNPSDEAGLQVANLGQANREGDVAIVVIRRPTARSPHTPRMNLQVARRFWRSSMGRSEVTARCLAIRMATSYGRSASKDRCRLVAMSAGVDDIAERGR